MRLELTPDADQELHEAIDWYDARQSMLGEEFMQLVGETFFSIESDPRRFPISEDAPAGREIRRCLMNRFPYVIVFEILGEVAHVLAVAHTSRLPGYWDSRNP